MRSFKNFPIECLEDIFRHLKVKDLLNCTLVCPEWNKFIGLTPLCIKRINLSCNTQDLIQDHNKKIILKSERKYERLVLWGNYYKTLLEIILAKGRKWTYVNLSLNFRTVNNFMNFLGTIQSTVQILELNIDMWRWKQNKELPQLQFP